MRKLLIIICFQHCFNLYGYFSGETDFEFFKKGNEEKRSLFSHILFNYENSSYFEFSRKDNLIDREHLYSWNARTSSGDRFKIIAGNYHAKFSSGMILSRMNSASSNPFLSSVLRTQKNPFLPESNANSDDSLFGSAISCSLFDLEELFLSVHMFYSDKKTYITFKDYEENETGRSLLSLHSSEGTKKEEIISSKLSGGSFCVGYDLLKININGLYSLVECGYERISSDGYDSYSAVSSYLSFGIKQSEIFSEICFSNSRDDDFSKTLSFQYGLKHSEKKYMISFIGKNLSETIYLPFGSPCGGKTPSVQYSFSGYVYMIDEIKSGAEIVQSRYKELNQSETHQIDEKVYMEIALGKKINLSGDYCRRKYYWKTDDDSDSFSAESSIYFKYIVLSSSFAKNDECKKIKNELETRSIKNISADLCYVHVLGDDSYYPADKNISLSFKYVSKGISSAVGWKRGFGKGEKYSRFLFSLSGLIGG
ncbi:MAG: hypothetical protein KAZ87_00795 [Spirochaetes bacterium]|nr:hypothetical protein [Spirochaetota bacterium]